MIIKNTIQLQIFLLIIFSVFFSCKKSDPVIYPQTLKRTALVQKTGVRLYVYGGKEIKDKDVINKFIWIYYADYFNITDSKNDTSYVTFMSKDSARFGNMDYDKYSVVKSNNRFLFYSNFDQYGSTSKNVPRLFLFAADSTAIPPHTGYEYVTKSVRVAYGNFNEMRFSMVAYQFVHHDAPYPLPGNSTFKGGIEPNEFDSRSIYSLKKYDTLAVQEYIVIYKKQ